MDITSAAIATIISSLTATLVAVCLNSRNEKRAERNEKKAEKKSLDSQLDDILNVAIQYPYLEDRTFTEKWTSKYDHSDENALRYELYATRVFNYLERFAEFYGYNQTQIEKRLAMRDWVRIHKKYWFDPTVPNENIDTYDKSFVDLVNNYLSGGNAR
ncbi:MAG: hypothetical protein MdMp014T_2039 [Treponematales bacterium]